LLLLCPEKVLSSQSSFLLADVNDGLSYNAL
jgi:hypothetical protein